MAAASGGAGFAKIRVRMTGTSGLVCDNIESMINPLAKDKKALVAKKNLTDFEQQQVFMLEWRMGLYLSPAGEPVIPARCIMAAFTTAARAIRKGKDIERGAVQPTELEYPILYDGPRDIKGMWEDPSERFKFTAIVNLTPTTPTRAMGVRVRPIFREWALEADMVVMLDMIEMSDVERILEITGRQGLCNARRIGYGKFTSEVISL